MTRVCGIFVFVLLAIWGPMCVASQTCIDCDNCAYCSKRTPFGLSESLVTISFDECKNGSKISWGCCRASFNATGDASYCYLSECDSPTENWENPKCNELTEAVFRVPTTASSLLVQVHDGKFIGNVDCGVTPCCGGSGGSCTNGGVLVGSTAVCEMEINLEDCTPSEDECEVDADCVPQNQLGECQKLSCIEGACVLQYKPSTTVCRPNKVGHACDVPENCTGATPYCPPDMERDKGYTFKCGTDLYICAMPNTTIVSGTSDTKRSWISPSYLTQGSNGTCNLGGGIWSIKELPWPQCVTSCIQRTCPNGKDISNYAVAHCNGTTAGWECDYKVDVTSADLLSRFPFCPYLSLW